MKSIFIMIFILTLGFNNLSAQSNNNVKITPSLPLKVKKITQNGKANYNSTNFQNKIEYLKNLEQYRKDNNVPEDFPKFIDTGNPKKDLDNYYKAKQEWIKNNPEKFEKIKHLNL